LSETGSALRATSDALLADLEALESIEQRKREMDPGNPQLVELAASAEQLARRVLGQSVRQRELSAVVHKLVEDGAPDAPAGSIEETPREIHLILADWRAAERRGREAKAGSAAARTAEADAARFQDEYRAAQEAARRRR